MPTYSTPNIIDAAAKVAARANYNSGSNYYTESNARKVLSAYLILRSNQTVGSYGTDSAVNADTVNRVASVTGIAPNDVNVFLYEYYYAYDAPTSDRNNPAIKTVEAGFYEKVPDSTIVKLCVGALAFLMVMVVVK